MLINLRSFCGMYYDGDTSPTLTFNTTPLTVTFKTFSIFECDIARADTTVFQSWQLFTSWRQYVWTTSQIIAVAEHEQLEYIS